MPSYSISGIPLGMLELAQEIDQMIKHILLEAAQYQLRIQDASPGFLLMCPSVTFQFPSLLYSWPLYLFFSVLFY